MRETAYWLINIACAIVILVLLGVHMGVMHLDAILARLVGTVPEPLAWENMVNRGKSTTQVVLYIVLLGTALFHGFYGLRTMLLEFFSSDRAARVITAGCVTAGGVLFVTGTAVTVVFALNGAG